MAKKSKLDPEATAMADRLVDDLAPLGEVRAKKMFGGYGVFESDVMFVLIDREGRPHLRADEHTAPRFEEAEGTKHDPMPYWSVPAVVLNDEAVLLEWAAESLAVARRAKQR